MGKWIFGSLIIAGVFGIGLYFGRGEEGLTKLVEAIRSMKLGYVGGGLLLVLGGVPVFFKSALDRFSKKDSLAGAKLFYMPAVAFLFFCLVMQVGLDLTDRLLPVFAPTPPSLDNVEVNLIALNGIPDVEFSVRWIAPNQNSDPVEGHNGTARIQVPHGTKAVTQAFISKCPTYTATSTGPFNTDGGKISIPVRKIEAEPPPLPPKQLPMTLLTERPTAAQLAGKPKLPPDQVSFFYKNVSGQALELWIFDWSNYEVHRKEANYNGTSWLTFEFESKDEFVEYSHIKKGTGWYSFVLEDKTGQTQVLELRNIFQKHINKLTVKPPAQAGGQFIVEFSESDSGR